MKQEELEFQREKKCTECGNTFPETREFFHFKGKRYNGKQQLRAKCKTCRNNRKTKWYNSINGRWLCVIQGANKRDKIIDITKEEFAAIVKTPCVYCGEESIEGVKLNALDRVYNDMPYTIDNVVSCCGDCNMLKGSFDGMDFIERCTKIFNNRQKKLLNITQATRNTLHEKSNVECRKVYLEDSGVGEIIKENFIDPIW